MARKNEKGRLRVANKPPGLVAKEIADNREVYAIRRSLSDLSKEVIRHAFEQGLVDEIRGSGRLFLPETLGITVVGFSRYTRRGIERSPKTEEMIDASVYGEKTIVADLGNLVMIGAQNKPTKLAIELISDDLVTEREEYEGRFLRLGIPLKPDFNCPDPELGSMPHLSIGVVYSDRSAFFNDARTLNRLTSILGLVGQGVELEPPSRFNPSLSAS